MYLVDLFNKLFNSGFRVFVFVFFIFVFQMFLAAYLPLCQDEAYYWTWSKQLDIGYFDHPPFIAWMIAFGTYLFGDTSFGIRSMALLGSILMSILSYRFALDFFKNKRAGYCSLVLWSTSPISFIGFIIMTPDVPLILASSFSIFCFWQANQNGRLWWVFLGICLGLAMLSKFTAILLFPCLLAWLLFDLKSRYWLLTPWPYISCLIAISIFSPVIFWNIQHEWITFLFQLNHRFSSSGGGINSLMLYLLATAHKVEVV